MSLSACPSRDYRLQPQIGRENQSIPGSPIGAPGGASGAGMTRIVSGGTLQEALDVRGQQRVLRLFAFGRRRLRLAGAPPACQA